MRYTIRYHSSMLVVKVLDDVTLSVDLSPLYDLVRTHIAQRRTAFMFEFTPESYFYSRHLAIVLKCAERIREADGVLALANPGKELAEALAVIDPEGHVRLAMSQGHADVALELAVTAG